MPVDFVLKRRLKGFEEYGDLYEAIKSGRKKVEYRDATNHWMVRLLSEKGILFKNFYKGRSMEFTGSYLKHDTAVFRVGYTKYPRLVADITKIVFNYDSKQYEVHIDNVREETQ
ncbi:MAG: hypothetical protein ACTSPB_01285 [Candidatus Thorarchaeota archaeon]